MIVLSSGAGGRYSFAPHLTISPATQSFTATGGPGSVAVTAPGGGASNNTLSFTVASNLSSVSAASFSESAVAPGLFAANANGQGVAAAVALRVRGGVQTFEPVAQFDAATGRFVAAPIDLGQEGDQVILLLFGSGIRGRSALSAVTCTIGRVAVPVGFAAAAPGFIGLDQVNVGPLPRSLAGRGEVDVVLTVDGKEANRVRISIK